MRSVPMPVGPEAKALPRDVYVQIFARLSLPDLMRAALVSRAWKRLARDPEYARPTPWRRVCGLCALCGLG